MLRYLLVFLAGALLGANVVYYMLVMRTPTAPVARPDVAASPASAPRAPVATSAPATPPTSPVGPGGLQIPVAGVDAGQLVDTYTQTRSEGRLHAAIDIMAPAGTPVLAAVDGPVAKLFDSVQGGITLYQFDRAAQRVYYYAHLQAYAPGIAEGQQLRRGQLLGYVGSSGNASPDGPHLHFSVSELGPEKQWSKGTPVNPYPLLAGTGAGARSD
jgi:murein DD-endopeptidase MepM/ murein hydrolase activator NlpD